MDSRLLLILGYGAVFVSTAVWAGHYFGLRERARWALVARGSSALSVVLVAVGLAVYGFQMGYGPFHTSYELLNVGLWGLLFASLTLLSKQRDGLLMVFASILATCMAVYGLVLGGLAEQATLAIDSIWWTAYVVLSGFGGGAMVVAGIVALTDGREQGEAIERAVTQHALSWCLLALSTGLAAGAWWFHRLSGRYWGDTRWAGTVVVVLLGTAAWHVRQIWLGRGWRSILVGALLILAGGYVVLGVGG